MSKTRSNHEGSIRQRSDGRYEVRITVSHDIMTGKPKRISKYADTKEEAIKLLNQMNFTLNTRPKNFEKVTLAQWLKLCLEVYMKPSVKQSTYLSYESYIRVHLEPALGDIFLQDLVPRTLQNFYNYKSQEEGLSPKTIVNINLFLHRALDFAVSEGLINSNPTSSVNLPRGPKPTISVLSRDEQNKLIYASYQHRFGVFVRLTLFTGVRIGELLGLRWEDVDVTGRLLYIRRTLNRLNKVERPTTPGEATTEIVIQTPKSDNSARSIPLLPQVLQDLQAWRSMQLAEKAQAGDAYVDSGMIVTNPLGGYVEPRTFKDSYNNILTMAGLPHFTFHALRHTFATRAMEQGMDAKTLSIILGHASVAFTSDTYTHVLNEHKHEGMALMEDLFTAPQVTGSNQPYPIVITFTPNGPIDIACPNFPSISYYGTDFNQGLMMIREDIQEELLTCIIPPQPIPVNQIPIEPNQQVLMITPST